MAETRRDHSLFAAICLWLLAVVSPLISIIFATGRALYGGYSTIYLTDPGHLRIRIYDRMVVATVILIVLLAFAFTYQFNSQLFAEAMTEQGRNIIFGAQFSGWTSFFMLYALSLGLTYYGTNRARIIRRINEKKGAW